MASLMRRLTGPGGRPGLVRRTTRRAGALLALLLVGTPLPALSHPHVFIQANLEILRNEKGEATEVRHVWRFDEIFSSTVIYDFDEDGDSKLSVPELEEVAKVVKENIADFNFYTEIREGSEVINFYEPDPFLADMDNNQLLLILAMELEKPQQMTGEKFKVAVSDPTYYVAVELSDETGIMVNGPGTCSHEIIVPDWDALMAKDAERISKLFTAAPDEEVDGSDDYLTWVTFDCKD